MIFEACFVTLARPKLSFSHKSFQDLAQVLRYPLEPTSLLSLLRHRLLNATKKAWNVQPLESKEQVTPLRPSLHDLEGLLCALG